MPFRTRLFLAWVGLTAVVWGGAYVVLNQSVKDNFDDVDRQTFAGIRRGLDQEFDNHVHSLRQACELVVNIPDLRAMIVETNYDLFASDDVSLRERLDYLRDTVDATFVAALNQSRQVVSCSDGAPWNSPTDMQEYLQSNAQVWDLVEHTFTATDESRHGLWTYRGGLFIVATMPLIFQDGLDGQHLPEGALVIGERIDDEFARDLGDTHHCHVSFISENVIAASSVPTESVPALLTSSVNQSGRDITVHDARGLAYRTIRYPLIDPCSKEVVAWVLVQRSRFQFEQFRSALLRNLTYVVLASLLVGAALSYLISSAITRPVHRLHEAVQRVSQGDLQPVFAKPGHGELGELAGAFNAMVVDLESSRHELQDAHDRMEQRVEVRTRQLKLANTVLQREVTERKNAESKAAAASQAKSDFLANMSHEIRTPMTAIIGFAQQLHDETLEQNQRIAAIRAIQRNGDHLLELINGILDLSKIEAGKLEVESIRCPVLQLVADVASLMNIRAQEKNVEFNVLFEGRLPETVVSDPMRLRQILLNFLGNAFKFTQAGRVELTVKMLDRESLRGASPPVPALRFDVTDTGIGMSEDQVARVFQPFTQADETTTRRFGGTGLGLTISKRLAELLDGEIRVSSRCGVGSTFSLLIPPGPLEGVRYLEDPGEMLRQTSQAPGPETVRVDGCRVLLAEDWEENRLLVTFLLERAGATVEVVHNGREAVDRITEAMKGNRDCWDVVLMDMQMPVLDGYTATKLLRSRGCPLPVIALTAHAMKGDREKCLAAGCDEHVTKPIDPAALTAAIDRLWGEGNPADGFLRRRATGLGDEKPRIVAEAMASDPQPEPVRELSAAQAALPEAEPSCEAETSGNGLEVFNRDGLLQRCLDNRQLADSLIERFLERASDDFARLESLLEEGLSDDFIELAHGLKGSAANLSARRLSLAAGRLEEAAEKGDRELLQELWSSLEEAWQEFRVVAADHLNVSSNQEVESKE